METAEQNTKQVMEENEALKQLIELLNQQDMDGEYSCAMKSHFRKSGNQMTGRRKSSNASLLAQCFV